MVNYTTIPACTDIGIGSRRRSSGSDGSSSDNNGDSVVFIDIFETLMAETHQIDKHDSFRIACIVRI